MKSSWAVEEIKTVDLNDKRLNERFAQILCDLGERPTASIPQACGGKNELEAAYRFFDNDKVTAQRILQPHYARTLQRMSAQDDVLLMVQDTTEADVTRPAQQMKGAGPLSNSSRRGAFLHLLEAFTPDGTPLGAVWADTWVREPKEDESPPPSRSEKDRKRRQTPIEEKESFRWLQGLRHARRAAQELPHRTCVCIGDSDADIYELFTEPRGRIPVHWLVRACHDRVIQKPSDSEVATGLLRESVLSTPVLFTNQITVRAHHPKVPCDKRARRQPRKSRKTIVEVRATTVTLCPPSRPDRKLPEVKVNVVLVHEVTPPEGDEPVEWLLITTLPITTIHQVQEIIRYYSVRFMIEVLFRTLKSGCRVEQRQFKAIERFLPCLAIYLIVAWRTLMVCRLGRSCPGLDCETIFEPSEWQSVWVATQRKPLPNKAPALDTMVRLIAQLGGYINRPNRKDPPGPQTVWLGLQRMRDLAWGWDTFGPGANQASDKKQLK